MGDRKSYRLFFDNLNSRFAGRENLTHLALYKRMPGFIARLDVLDYDMPAAAHTAQIRAELKRAGLQIGPYDQMIAGHARSRGLVVVTHNTKEFERVAGLRIEDWLT